MPSGSCHLLPFLPELPESPDHKNHNKKKNISIDPLSQFSSTLFKFPKPNTAFNAEFA